VHIYRLVTAKTVEENILAKAQQKRHLDFLVMTAGGFHKTVADVAIDKQKEKEEKEEAAAAAAAAAVVTGEGEGGGGGGGGGVFTHSGLLDILGVSGAKNLNSDGSNGGSSGATLEVAREEEEAPAATAAEVEAAMAQLEVTADCHLILLVAVLQQFVCIFFEKQI
jgi:hypothetical protein